VSERELKELNAVEALKMGLITWFEYFEIMRGLK
jgi:hypothetical protein